MNSAELAFKGFVMMLCLTTLQACGVRDRLEATKQVRTTSLLQHIHGDLKGSVGEQGEVSFRQLQEVIEGVNAGLDGWGNDFLFTVAPSGSFVVLSRGRDGKMDLERLEDYFNVGPRRVQGQYDRDIVFRDGIPLWNAGK